MRSTALVWCRRGAEYATKASSGPVFHNLGRIQVCLVVHVLVNITTKSTRSRMAWRKKKNENEENEKKRTARRIVLVASGQWPYILWIRERFVATNSGGRSLISSLQTSAVDGWRVVGSHRLRCLNHEGLKLGVGGSCTGGLGHSGQTQMLWQENPGWARRANGGRRCGISPLAGLGLIRWDKAPLTKMAHRFHNQQSEFSRSWICTDNGSFSS